jgi:hypothetical protein
MTRPTVFLSYCHRDEIWKDRISSHLRVLGDHLEVWDDRQIRPGEDWFPAIQSAITKAQVVILVISKDFLTSPFIKSEEVPRFLKLRQTNGLTVIPVIASPCAWQAVDWLSAIQCYPKDGRALSKVRTAQRDEDLAILTLKVSELLAELEEAGRWSRENRGELNFSQKESLEASIRNQTFEAKPLILQSKTSKPGGGRLWTSVSHGIFRKLVGVWCLLPI